jgi:hypothetical protein
VAAILAALEAFVAAGAGFLLAVLWFDLMFDVQVSGSARDEVPEPALASIATYYRRVTTTARPMNRLVAVTMLATLAAIVVEIVQADDATWVGWTSLALVLVAFGLAGGRTVPSAVRLGARTDPAERQSHLAQAIFRDHLVCLLAITALLVVQLANTSG